MNPVSGHMRPVTYPDACSVIKPDLVPLYQPVVTKRPGISERMNRATLGGICALLDNQPSDGYRGGGTVERVRYHAQLHGVAGGIVRHVELARGIVQVPGARRQVRQTCNTPQGFVIHEKVFRERARGILGLAFPVTRNLGI